MLRILSGVLAASIFIAIFVGMWRSWIQAQGGKKAWEEAKKEMREVFSLTLIITALFVLAFFLLIYAIQGHL